MTRRRTPPPPWRIRRSHRKDPGHPWLLSRWTSDGRYAPVVRCRSYSAAVNLLRALLWLDAHADTLD